MGGLTTHILDTERGCPASGVEIELVGFFADGPAVLARAVTNADGRTDAPLLEGSAFKPGIYELRFKTGPYFERTGRTLAEPKFLDTIVIRFGVSSSSEHYHVPLLLHANGYATYRGS